ncbi:hypothetical protein PILCRDRAFT_813989 [Piloderma croceum F 1598]|uniref:Uncharacterized protein n=1 Tax=Piloderma croceum (strain F 1598) TaxID=765440 RepID=A0A0C3GBT9_PILCF|nr:hypothetical protein PILCRDRAFT_828120 [Piloderma croceum F 1598]KIM88086.1 hypothetical protein PILCRDRAFT_813989 [Piloderma croceum F 1598]
MPPNTQMISFSCQQGLVSIYPIAVPVSGAITLRWPSLTRKMSKSSTVPKFGKGTLKIII